MINNYDQSFNKILQIIETKGIITSSEIENIYVQKFTRDYAIKQLKELDYLTYEKRGNKLVFYKKDESIFYKTINKSK